MTPLQKPEGSSLSKIEMFAGKYTPDVLVAFLFALLLGAIVCANLSDGINNKLTDGILLLIGFFAGNKVQK
ncbi:MAG: hypothetical protein HQ510_07115 [Candidatus Marinimicrobia bacterium]|nr:hypothetical protein [Candidatus Neomarinimicrobiota bacterium]